MDVNIIAKPRSSQVFIEIMEDNSLVIHVKEPPDKGKANKAILKLISKTFGIPSSKMSILRGAKTTSKIIRIEDLEKEAFQRMLTDHENME